MSRPRSTAEMGRAEKAAIPLSSGYSIWTWTFFSDEEPVSVNLTKVLVFSTRRLRNREGRVGLRGLGHINWVLVLIFMASVNYCPYALL